MSEPLPLPEQVEAQFIDKAVKGRKAREAGDVDTAERYYLEAWNVIPEPRLDYDHAASTVVAMTEFYRDIGQPAKAKPWLALAREAYGPGPEVHTEFLAATVHYAASEFDQAYELFDEVYEQFRRRPFQGENPAYLEFYLDRAAAIEEGRTPVDPVPVPAGPLAGLGSADEDDEEELPDDIYEEIEALSEEGNELSDEGEYEGAESVWRQALDLLPEPQTKWSAYTWLTTSIGEACYFQENYAGAAQMLFDALNGPDAQENPFVHYMLGKALWRRGDDPERAIDELLRAYMLDGSDIFEGDEDEGPDMLRLLIERDLIDED
ncbi:tetratricopeptide repeat protein [Bordetella genomosp. 13]|uniref:tetratricopeptide repeat protein n=1 Tax=Bordetella genomosp. 13 TaxID=463040 RepID=UPI0021B5C25C|nr:hypothetical protein [Bordetella genomosp. 13]